MRGQELPAFGKHIACKHFRGPLVSRHSAPRFFAWPFTFPLASISTNFIQAAPLTFWSCPRRSDIPTSCLKHDHDARIHLATSFGALRHADRSQGPQKQRCTREPPPPPWRRIAARTNLQGAPASRHRCSAQAPATPAIEGTLTNSETDGLGKSKLL